MPQCARLRKKGGHRLDACFSVAMPNTYVCLPGFDVDSTEVQQQKLKASESRVKEIAGHINNMKRGIIDVVRGSVPRLKSYVLRPLFNAFLTGDKRFRTTDRCNGCGVCIRVCPKRNIRKSTDGTPQWCGDCENCLNCYHRCPQHAIAYGKTTQGKGQYYYRSQKNNCD